jgi:Spy/CpxP family protein refolding chaperone
MKIKILIGILLFLIILNLAVLGTYVYRQWINPVSTQDFQPHHRMFSGNERAKLHSPTMRLNSEQRQKMHDLRMHFREAVLPHRREITNLRAQIAQALLSDKIDTAMVYGRLDAIAREEEQIEKATIRMMLQTRQFLTNQQVSFLYDKMHEFYENRRMEHQRGRGMRGGSGRGSLNKDNK